MIPANKITNYHQLGNRLVGETHESRMRRVNAANHQTGLVGQAKAMPKIVGARKPLQQLLGQTENNRMRQADRASVDQYVAQLQDQVAQRRGRFGDSIVWAGAVGLALGLGMNALPQGDNNKLWRTIAVAVGAGAGAIAATSTSKPNADATGRPILGLGVVGVGAVAAIAVGLTSGWEQVQKKKGGWKGALGNGVPVLGIGAAAAAAAAYPETRRFIAGGAVAAGAAVLANRMFETVSS